MIKTHYIKLRMATNTKKKIDMQEKQGRKPEKVKIRPVMSQIEKEARIIDAAKKLGVKIGGAK